MENSPENRFGSQYEDFAFLGLAGLVTGRDFPNSQDGLTEAIAAMQIQHQKVMPNFSYDEAAYLVSQWEPVHVAEVMGQSALSAEVFDEVLYFSNQLFVFGEVDLQRDLGNRAFQISLQFHRQFADLIRERFSGTDPYLIMAGKATYSDIEKLREAGDEQVELTILRGVIHMIALNGTLGGKAKEQVDPMAIASL